MLTTINILEMQLIIDSNHSDPHRVLGMHEVNHNNKQSLVVRAYIPQAKTINVVDAKNKNKKYPMEKIHSYGFFECIIPNRKKWFQYKLEITDYNSNSWTTYDPYEFSVGIGEQDIYLFNQGTHYEIYNKLGANPTIIDGVEGVLFGVWAPNAKRVSVIGEFNNWDGRRNAMRLLQNSGIWEIFVPGLKNNDKYKFEIKTSDNKLIQKADPYEKFAELRPSTSSLVYNINNYKWSDNNWLKEQAQKDKFNSPMNIYEVHLGSWKRVENDNNRFLSYLELADELIPYVKEMGYTHIEILPIEEHPFDGSWGYQVTGYYAPTSRYGNPEEFMHFIDRCHQSGIGVILDWVPAHFPKDAHALAKFDGTALYEHQNSKQGEHPEWGTLIFNYGRNEVKNFLIANALFWIEKYHIDALRVDAVASMLYLDYCKNEGEWIPNKYGGRENLEAVEFLKHLNSIIASKYPYVHIIAEESTSWEGVTTKVEEGGLGFTLKWNMGWMNDFLEYVELDPIYKKYHHYNMTFASTYAYSEKFVLVLSHDEVVHGKKSMLDKMPGDLWQKFSNLRAAYGFFMTHPGKKLLFMGGEFGQFIEWNENRPLDWFLLEYDHHKQMQDYVKELNKTYLNSKALWQKDFDGFGFEWIDADNKDRSIYSFIRRGETKEDTLVVVCNFTPNTDELFRIAVPFEGNWQEILNSDDIKFGGSGVVNSNVLKSEKILCNNRENSVALRLAPLSVTILKAL